MVNLALRSTRIHSILQAIVHAGARLLSLAQSRLLLLRLGGRSQLGGGALVDELHICGAKL